jgi:hypothetical protein
VIDMAHTEPLIPDHIAVRYAMLVLTPGERLELLAYLGYPDELPKGTQNRVMAVLRVAQARAWNDAWERALVWRQLPFDERAKRKPSNPYETEV